MTDTFTQNLSPLDPASPHQKKVRRHRWLRRIGWMLLIIVALLGIARLLMPSAIRSYVNHTLDRNPLYDGSIGGISVHLYRGAYSIEDVELIKTTGNVPVPLFKAKRVDLSIEWAALWHGSLVGRVSVDQPQLNFVDGEEKADSQTPGGLGGGSDEAAGGTARGGDLAAASSAPWLGMIRDLFPFKINSARVNGGSVHFRSYSGDVPVDIYISQLDAQLDNLTNIRDETTPLITTATATGLAMDQARFEYQMKIDPFSYHPTFTLVTRLIGLDVTKLNEFARRYGNADFEKGWFDLVVELDATEGQLRGYVKPLFRDLSIIGEQDLKEDDPIGVFWEAILGVTAEVLENQPRNQLGTLIPFRGDVAGPRPDVFVTIGNVLRNAFIRAYLPKLQGRQQVEGMQFEPASLDEPATLTK